MRLREISYETRRESYDSQRRAGRCNPARVIKFDGRRHVLPVGDSDYWKVYRVLGDKSGRVFVCSVNERFSYGGVQAYDRDDQEPAIELGIFLQDESFEQEIGKLDKLTFRTIARRLIERLEEVTA